MAPPRRRATATGGLRRRDHGRRDTTRASGKRAHFAGAVHRSAPARTHRASRRLCSHHRPSPRPRRARCSASQRERATHVRVTLRRRQVCLRRCRAGPPQCADIGDGSRCRAMSSAWLKPRVRRRRAVQRHRHHDVSALEELRPVSGRAARPAAAPASGAASYLRAWTIARRDALVSADRPRAPDVPRGSPRQRPHWRRRTRPLARTAADPRTCHRQGAG